MSLNYDLFSDRHLNFGCHGYDYYYNALQELKNLSETKSNGPCVVYHYESDSIWKIFRLEEGLLQGVYLQNGGIESPTIYSNYNQGKLHGYHVAIYYIDRIVSFYDNGRLQFRFNQQPEGHVYSYVAMIDEKEHKIQSPNKCIHCIVSKLKKAYKSKHKNY